MICRLGYVYLILRISSNCCSDSIIALELQNNILPYDMWMASKSHPRILTNTRFANVIKANIVFFIITTNIRHHCILDKYPNDSSAGESYNTAHKLHGLYLKTWMVLLYFDSITFILGEKRQFRVIFKPRISHYRFHEPWQWSISPMGVDYTSLKAHDHAVRRLDSHQTITLTKFTKVYILIATSIVVYLYIII